MYSKTAIQRRARQIAERYANITAVKGVTGIKKSIEDEPLYKEWYKVQDEFNRVKPYLIDDSENTYNFYAGMQGREDIAKVKFPFITKLEGLLKSGQTAMSASRTKIQGMVAKLEAANDADAEYPGSNIYDGPLSDAKRMLEDLDHYEKCLREAQAEIPETLKRVTDAIQQALQPMASKLAAITGQD